MSRFLPKNPFLKRRTTTPPGVGGYPPLAGGPPPGGVVQPWGGVVSDPGVGVVGDSGCRGVTKWGTSSQSVIFFAHGVCRCVGMWLRPRPWGLDRQDRGVSENFGGGLKIFGGSGSTESRSLKNLGGQSPWDSVFSKLDPLAEIFRWLVVGS